MRIKWHEDKVYFSSGLCSSYCWLQSNFDLKIAVVDLGCFLLVVDALFFIKYHKTNKKENKSTEEVLRDWVPLPFKRQSHKMVKHTQAIRGQFTDELFECVWPFCDTGA